MTGLMLIVAAWCAVLLLGCWRTRRAKADEAEKPVPYLPTAKADGALRCGCGDCLAARPVNDIEWAAMVRACWKGEDA